MVAKRDRSGLLPVHATVFLDEVPVITECGGVFRVEYSSGDAVFAIAVTPHVMRAGIAAAQAELAKWQVNQLGVVEPIGRKRG